MSLFASLSNQDLKVKYSYSLVDGMSLFSSLNHDAKVKYSYSLVNGMS